MPTSFEQLDDAAVFARPLSFNPNAATAQFGRFLAALNHSLDTEHRFKTEHSDDASFHSQIFVSETDDDVPFIRFSNFGNLVSLYADNEIDDSLFGLLKSLFEEFGYEYLEFRDLAVNALDRIRI